MGKDRKEERKMAASEFLVVDVGADGVKIGGGLTILAVAATLDEARGKASDVQPRSSFVAIVERKLFFRRKPKIELETLESPLVRQEPPAKEPPAKEEPK